MNLCGWSLYKGALHSPGNTVFNETTVFQPHEEIRCRKTWACVHDLPDVSLPHLLGLLNVCVAVSRCWRTKAALSASRISQLSKSFYSAAPSPLCQLITTERRQAAIFRQDYPPGSPITLAFSWVMANRLMPSFSFTWQGFLVFFLIVHIFTVPSSCLQFPLGRRAACDIYWHGVSFHDNENIVSGQVNKFPGIKSVFYCPNTTTVRCRSISNEQFSCVRFCSSSRTRISCILRWILFWFEKLFFDVMEYFHLKCCCWSLQN